MAVQYIFERSVQNAEKVRADILEKISSLPEHSEIHPPDKYKQNNDGNDRALELHRLRIAHHISAKEIKVVRVRSTYQEPQTYV